MAWTYDKVVEIAKGMEARIATGFHVSAATAPLVVEALKHFAREGFGEMHRGYCVDVWDQAGSRVERHYAKVADLYAARDAFTRAAAQDPKALVTLRRGIRVIESTERR